MRNDERRDIPNYHTPGVAERIRGFLNKADEEYEFKGTVGLIDSRNPGTVYIIEPRHNSEPGSRETVSVQA